MDSSGHRRNIDAVAVQPIRLLDGRMLRRLAIMILIVAAVLGALYFFKTMRDTAIKNIFSRQPPPIVVATTKAEMQSVPHFLAGIGTIAAVHQVTVSSQIGGMVTQILFVPGQTVQAGDPLVQLDDGPEQGDLANFEAQARYAVATLHRNQELLAKQAAAQAIVDQNRSQLDQANGSIAKTKALIAQKLIRAPFSGKLGVRQVEVGQYVGPGTAMVTLSDLSQLYINFTLPEQAAAALVVGQDIDFAVDAYPGERFKAKINAIEPQLSADTRSIKVQATMDNPDSKLLPGMFANVRVVLPPRPDVVTVPETAVENTLYGDSVYLIQEDGVDAAGKPVLRAKREPVTTGEHVNGRVAILSGLKPGDAVVALGQNKVLFDGAAVAPDEQGALALPAKLPNN
jgi:membrane fusion protein, multidrug efflux system